MGQQISTFQISYVMYYANVGLILLWEIQPNWLRKLGTWAVILYKDAVLLE